MCLGGCLICQKREKIVGGYNSDSMAPYDRKVVGGSVANFDMKRDSLIISPLERSTLTTNGTLNVG